MMKFGISLIVRGDPDAQSHTYSKEAALQVNPRPGCGTLHNERKYCKDQ